MILVTASGCAKKYASRDPMTGYAQDPGYRENPETQPTYKANPEFEAFARETPTPKPQPNSEATPARTNPNPGVKPPVPMPIYESGTPGAPAFNPTFTVSAPKATPKPQSTSNDPREQAIEFYADGELINAGLLPVEGAGFFTIPAFRRHQYTTIDMQKVIEYVALKFSDRYRKNIAIGTISQRGGGKIVTPDHASHQNGLDADVLLPRRDDQKPGTLVVNGKVTDNFDAIATYDLIQTFVSTNRIRKIFVNRAIKNALCIQSSLRNLKPDPLQTKIASIKDHTTHMHVRLTCPLASPRCIEQAEFINDTTSCGILN